MNETYRIDRYVAAKKRYTKAVAETEKLRREMMKAAGLLSGLTANLTQFQLNRINAMIQNERRYRMADRVLKRSLPNNVVRSIKTIV